MHQVWPISMTLPAEILAVDDDQATLSGWTELLRREGYLVRSVRAFEDARRLLTTSPPDLLITDVRLGSFNGLQLVLRARALNPSVPAIVVTAFPDPLLESEAARYGARFVVKPVAPAMLLGLVAELLALPRSR
jgi:DNA-binding NtrC family response regulator